MNMTKLPPTHDFLPAAGRTSLLPTYDLMTRLMGVPRLHRALIRQADLRPGQHVLEIGCGTGNLSALAAPHVDLIATDPDAKALTRARRKVKGARFEQAYVQALPYPDATFEVALSALMLHHLTPEAKVEGAAELFRVLTRGGVFHVVDITGHGVLAHGASPHFGDDLLMLLADAGFEPREVAAERHRLLGQVSFIEARKS
jgi:ubiquinone/menaquinone biosynthesis C-methylase UbiE